jgi:hypothetical protein
MKSRAITGVATGQKLGRAKFAVAGSVTVSVDDPPSEPGVIVGGLKLPVAPVGRPETLSVTVPVKLAPTSATVIGKVVVPPG